MNNKKENKRYKNTDAVAICEKSIKEKILSGEVDFTTTEEKVICPWCGEPIYFCLREGNSFLVNEGEHEITCDRCGNKLKVFTHLSYFYDTERIERSNENAE